MAREINLVPDIKDEMIKTLKLRNFIFFLCIIVATASIGVTLVFGLILGGQQIALESKKTTLNNLSAKLNSYGDLNDFLTIKDQLGNLSNLSSNKQVLSRTFGILSAIIPTGADTITISELNVNLSGEQPTFTFDAQANAGKEPYIDYNVLDSFKKSMQYMRYDYGNYVDRDGNTIPAYCIIESGTDGATFRDSARGIYALWAINGEGCNPASSASDGTGSGSNTNANSESASSSSSTTAYSFEEYDGQQVVRIWRTPQFSEWYTNSETTNQSFMSLSGEISNVPHFESSCITYTGHTGTDYVAQQGETVVYRAGNMTWTSQNSACKLVPGADANGDGGIRISDSSNGRGASDELVLRFSAVITFAPEVYAFNNHHMLAIPPSGRFNVTDSYVQIQAMFGERAADCAEDDTACNTKEGA